LNPSIITLIGFFLDALNFGTKKIVLADRLKATTKHINLAIAFSLQIKRFAFFKIKIESTLLSQIYKFLQNLF